MISENIKKQREILHLSQNQLAKNLGISRSSVNAWEMGISVPTTQYVVEMAKLFHISTDTLILGKEIKTISINGLDQTQVDIIYKLLDYFKNINQ